MAVSDHGDVEYVSTVVGPNGERLPLVAIDRKGLSILRRYSQDLANRTGKTVSIISFTRRKLCDTVVPVATRD